MNEEQQSFIQGVDHAPQKEVIVKVTGREGIDLAPHSHNRVQLVEAVTGTLRVTVGDREYFVPEGYACWIPAGMTHALTSHNRRIALRIFYFQRDGKDDVDSTFSVHYVCPWAAANFRFIADYGPAISAGSDGLYTFCLSFSAPSARRSGGWCCPCVASTQTLRQRSERRWPISTPILPTTSC